MPKVATSIALPPSYDSRCDVTPSDGSGDATKVGPSIIVVPIICALSEIKFDPNGYKSVSIDNLTVFGYNYCTYMDSIHAFVFSKTADASDTGYFKQIFDHSTNRSIDTVSGIIKSTTDRSYFTASFYSAIKCAIKFINSSC